MYLFHPNSGSVPATKARIHIVPITRFIPCILLLKAPYINIKWHKSGDIEYRRKIVGIAPPISSIGKRIQHPRPLNVYSSNGPYDCHAWNCSQETIHLKYNQNTMNSKYLCQKFQEIKTWCSKENGTGYRVTTLLELWIDIDLCTS